MPGAINPATVLAKIRSKIDAQQQVISLLEGQLQNAILGGGTSTKEAIIGFGSAEISNASFTTAGTGSIGEIYNNAVDGNTVAQFITAIDAGLGEMGHVGDTDELEQDALRQLLYQARALLGELRIEEQAWNGEINSEKTLRKEVNDFAKV